MQFPTVKFTTANLTWREITPPPPAQNTFGPTEGQNEQWREANRRRRRQTIGYRGLVQTPPPPYAYQDVHVWSTL